MSWCGSSYKKTDYYDDSVINHGGIVISQELAEGNFASNSSGYQLNQGNNFAGEIIVGNGFLLAIDAVYDSMFNIDGLGESALVEVDPTGAVKINNEPTTTKIFSNGIRLEVKPVDSL